MIGADHGINAEDLKIIADKTVEAVEKVNNDRDTNQIPYRDLPYDKQMLKDIKKMADELKGKCKNFVVLGIGGSALGNIALQTALNPYTYNLDDKNRSTPRLFVFDNVDPDQLGSFLESISDQIDGTIFNVISKSGRTAETASQFLIIKKLLEDKLGPEGVKNQIIATTDAKEGTMRKITDHLGFKNLVVPDGVGGRFSVLSAVGLLSAAVCGIDIDALMAGAADMDKRVSVLDFYKNPAAINAGLNYYFYNKGKNISVMMPYSYHLKDFADWYRQLWAESLGKTNDLTGKQVNIGPTPVKALGTTDQHSQVQLYREGPNDKLFTFLQVNNFERQLKTGNAPDCAPELDYLSQIELDKLLNAEKFATEYALMKDSRPCLTIIFNKITPYTVGQFIYLYEVTTSIIATLFGINAYDQPAVELGKEATFALMARPGYEELAEKIKPVTQIDGEFLI